MSHERRACSASTRPLGGCRLVVDDELLRVEQGPQQVAQAAERCRSASARYSPAVFSSRSVGRRLTVRRYASTTSSSGV